MAALASVLEVVSDAGSNLALDFVRFRLRRALTRTARAPQPDRLIELDWRSPDMSVSSSSKTTKLSRLIHATEGPGRPTSWVGFKQKTAGIGPEARPAVSWIVVVLRPVSGQGRSPPQAIRARHRHGFGTASCVTAGRGARTAPTHPQPAGDSPNRPGVLRPAWACTLHSAARGLERNPRKPRGLRP